MAAFIKMPSRKKGGKSKDAQLVIRINKQERDEFIELCEDLDTSAAREIRRFIREFTTNSSKANN